MTIDARALMYPGQMPALRWGTEAPPDASAARERIIDAAEACFQRFGVAKTTVEDVATRANVSRATVYRYFDGRDDIILGVLLRQGSRFLDRLEHRLATEPDLRSAILAGVIYTIKAVRADDVLAMLFSSESAGLTGTVAGTSDALFRTTADFLRPQFERARRVGDLRPDVDIDDAAEWTLRVILSLLTVSGPRTRTEDELRAYLDTFLIPSLVTDRRGGTARRHRRGAARTPVPTRPEASATA